MRNFATLLNIIIPKEDKKQSQLLKCASSQNSHENICYNIIQNNIENSKKNANREDQKRDLKQINIWKTLLCLKNWRPPLRNEKIVAYNVGTRSPSIKET